MFLGIGSLTIAIVLGVTSLIQNNFFIQANTGPDTQFTDPLGPNVPIGEAKGIFPGWVVWVYNPYTTNENCTNSSHSDAYWQS